MQFKEQSAPILLFNDECGVCRSIAHWVKKQVQAGMGAP
jgi:predicted DCC family thiol-disulfide oxidoreductase YuxK